MLPKHTTTLCERFSGIPCEACALKQLAAALRASECRRDTPTNAGRLPVELPHRFPPGGRPAPTSTLSSSHFDRFVRWVAFKAKALIMAIASHAGIA